MNILIVSSFLPYPLFSGGHIRLFNLIKQLSAKHKLTLICEKRLSQTDEDCAEVEKYCQKVITVPRKKQWSLPTIIKTGISINPFLTTGHTNFLMKQEITTALIKNNYDLIHAETFYILQNIPKTAIPIVLAEHNIEYLVYQRYLDNAPIYLKPLLIFDILKLKRSESKAWDRATKLIAVSNEDKRIMNRNNVAVIPNGVDLHTFTFRGKRENISFENKNEKSILYIGDFKWIQNRDAIRWIISDIWPYLLRELDSKFRIKLWIVGRNIPQDIKSLNKFDSIIFDENAPSKTSEIYKKADLLLAPLRVGGGTSFKILEAMSCGVAVVTTTLGIKGIEAIADREALVGNDTQTIVKKTAKILCDTDLYNEVIQNARKLIEEKYDWEIIAKQLDLVYKSVIK
jgi:polysaccharide biosynthesis protein PslH